jgi:hypothetical protein
MVERIAFTQSPRWRLSFSEWARVVLGGRFVVDEAAHRQALRGKAGLCPDSGPYRFWRYGYSDPVTRLLDLKAFLQEQCRWGDTAAPRRRREGEIQRPRVLV